MASCPARCSNLSSAWFRNILGASCWYTSCLPHPEYIFIRFAWMACGCVIVLIVKMILAQNICHRPFWVCLQFDEYLNKLGDNMHGIAHVLSAQRLIEYDDVCVPCAHYVFVKFSIQLERKIARCWNTTFDREKKNRSDECFYCCWSEWLEHIERGIYSIGSVVWHETLQQIAVISFSI